MTTVRVPLASPAYLEPRANARNARYPTAAFSGAMLDLANHALVARPKTIFQWSSLGASSSAGAGERRRWNCAFHSSPFVSTLWAVVIVAEQFDPALSPFIRIRCETLTPSTVGDLKFSGGRNNTSGVSDDPSRMTTTMLPFLATSGAPAVIPQDTDLTLSFSDFDNGRLWAACVFEQPVLPDTANGLLDPSISVLAPILDVTRQGLATTLSKLWRRGGAQLWNWTVDIFGSPITTTSTTTKNILDNTTLVIAAFTPGATLSIPGSFRVNATVFSPAAGATLPAVRVTMYVLAKVTANSGRVSLCDVVAATLGAVIVTATTPTWVSASFFIPATAAAAKYDLVYGNVIGSGTFSLYAVSIFVHDP